jgi:hypothetical protein
MEEYSGVMVYVRKWHKLARTTMRTLECGRKLALDRAESLVRPGRHTAGV